MNGIKSKTEKMNRKGLTLALVLFIICIVFLLLGFINQLFTLFGFIPLLAFLFVSGKYVRCPRCNRTRGVRMYLPWLIFTERNINCPHCGQKLECEHRK